MAIDGEDPTLPLPRIMCLHGGGTNSRIFRLQCRGLERALRSTFRLVYAEAPFPAKPGPDVTAVYKDCGPFKAWLRIWPDDPVQDATDVMTEVHDSIMAAKRHDDARGATGAWVGLLGFSQGAKLAASIIYSQQLRWQANSDSIWHGYRFAILLAGRGPLVWTHPSKTMPRGLVDAAQPTMMPAEKLETVLNSVEHLLRVPTIHVHGLQDPNIGLHRKLLHRYCDPENATLLEWDGAHRVPIKLKDVNAIVDHVFSVAQEVGVLR
ncbi:hypothetical protein FH972_025083 [Carpinus fangiana]|uniref:Serine hydrolase domain-containing protein n=1 Tax=Carpinus fangiana TaxID=176857 RepID=A0A5N6L003_9ROSI|nr:hypothetical protein FH972_025083 [Carpinus fangiana]